jgi:DNA (cytosine-5)-methyltransferase 1
VKVLDLFSGIGGFSLGLERAGMQTIAFCEIDPFCRKVLSKHWPEVPIHEDIRTLDGGQFRGVDVVCGGFPCQPFSVAGKQRGKNDDRYLWPEMLRVIREVQPRFVIGENVAGIIRMELDTVLSDLEALGYACGAFVIPACAVDARHRRDRVWIICDRDRDRESVVPVDDETSRVSPDMAHADRSRLERRQETIRQEEKRSDHAGHNRAHFGRERRNAEWDTEPAVGRVAHGVPRRMDRLRALGNSVVPQIVEMIGRVIMRAA